MATLDDVRNELMLRRSRRAQDVARTGQRAEELTGTNVPAGPSEPSMIPDVAIPDWVPGVGGFNLRRFAPGEDPGATPGERFGAYALALGNKLSGDVVPTARDALSSPASAARLALKATGMQPAVDAARRGLSLASEAGVPVPDFLLPDRAVDPESDESIEQSRESPESAAAALAPAHYGVGEGVGDVINTAFAIPGLVDAAPTIAEGLKNAAGGARLQLGRVPGAVNAAASSPFARNLAAHAVEKAPYAVGGAVGGAFGHPVVGGLVGKAALGEKAGAMAARLRAAPDLEAAGADVMLGGQGGVEPPIPGGSPMPPGVHPDTPPSSAPIGEMTGQVNMPQPAPTRGLSPEMDFDVSGMPQGARAEQFPQGATAAPQGYSLGADDLRAGLRLPGENVDPLGPRLGANPTGRPETGDARAWVRDAVERDNTVPQGLLDEAIAMQEGTQPGRRGASLRLAAVPRSPSPIRFTDPVTEGRVPPMSPTDAAEMRDINIANNPTGEEMGGYVRVKNRPSSQAYNEAMAADDITRGGRPPNRAPPPPAEQMAASMRGLPPQMRDAALAAIENQEGPAYAAEVRAALTGQRPPSPFTRAQRGNPPGMVRGRGGRR